MNEERKEELQPPNNLSRRQFLQTTGQGLLVVGVGAGIGTEMMRGAQAQTYPATASSTSPADIALSQKPIALPPFTASTERLPAKAPLPLPPQSRVGFAVVGLGNLALTQILPAFAQSKKARLTALVSGDTSKAREVAVQYGVPENGLYNYQNYDHLRDNPDVQVIYIVLPNSMHAEYTVRGAQAGKHILCEKPMATSPGEAQTMIDACKNANRKLMIAYRIQYEPHNRLARKWVRTQQYGAVKLIESVNGQNQGDPNQWRQKKSLAGGGSLPDVGLYCLNTIRALTGEEPNEIFASIYSTPNDPRFREVEESVTWQMRFPSGLLANCATSYGFHEDRRYRVHAERGWFGLDPAFSYSGLQMQLSYAQDDIEFRQTPQIEEKNQFALELDHMADCVINNRQPHTPGEEGLQDQKLMAAIYESARNNRPVKLPTLDGRDLFRGPQPSEM